MAVLKIPVTKGKNTVEIDSDALPEEVYKEALMQGLKVLVNRGMSKIATSGLEGEKLAEAQEAAMVKARENVDNILAGKIRIMAAKADKVPGVVNTEAMRIARNIVKDTLKRAGQKVSYYPAKEITNAAKLLLTQRPEILEQAKESLAQRDAAKANFTIDITAIKPSQALIDKAEKAKKEKKGTLSAKQAGMTATRQKPAAQPTAH